jgi:hypothetical protein
MVNNLSSYSEGNNVNNTSNLKTEKLTSQLNMLNILMDLPKSITLFMTSNYLVRCFYGNSRIDLYLNIFGASFVVFDWLYGFFASKMKHKT